MKFDPEKHRRRSVRLQDDDYSQEGAYFITICTHKRELLFGQVAGDIIQLNSLGRVVQEEWLRTAEMRPSVVLDQYVIMPNHFHGIIVLHESRGTLPRALRHEQFSKPTLNSILTIIRLFKSSVTTGINQERQMPHAPVWQRGYHEHIIRNEVDLAHTREYIVSDPARWQLDEYYNKYPT